MAIDASTTFDFCFWDRPRSNWFVGHPSHSQGASDSSTLRGSTWIRWVKYADAPGTSRSMRVAIEDLSLDQLWVVYPGREAYRLDEKISVLPVGQIPELRARLRS